MPTGIYKRKKVKIIPKDILDELYSKRKLSSTQCAQLLDCSYRTILGRLKEYGLHIRSQSESKKGIPRPSRRIQIDEEKLKKLYVNKKMNTVECGEIFGCSHITINRRLRGLDISIRESDTQFKRGQKPNGGLKTRFKNGKDHPFWKGGISSLYDKIKQTSQYKVWRDSVYRKDNWHCQACNKHCEKGDITAHHKKSFTDYAKLRFDVDNGTTLCRGCHLKIHRGEEQLNDWPKIYAYASKIY